MDKKDYAICITRIEYDVREEVFKIDISSEYHMIDFINWHVRVRGGCICVHHPEVLYKVVEFLYEEDVQMLKHKILQEIKDFHPWIFEVLNCDSCGNLKEIDDSWLAKKKKQLECNKKQPKE